MVRKWVESVRGIQQEDPLVPPWGKYEATSNDCLAPGAVDETAGFSNIAIATTEIADTEVASDPVGYPFERERKGRSQPPEQEEEGEHSRDEHAQELHSILHRIGQLKADFASTIKFLDQRVVELQNKFGGATNQTTKPGNRVQNDAPFSYGFTWEKIRDDWLSWVWSLARGEKTPPDQPTGRPQKRRLSRQSQQSNRCFVSRFKKDKLKTATEADFVLIAQSGAAAHKQEADCRSDAEQYFSLCNKRRPALENFTSSFHSAFTLLYGVSPESISPFLRTKLPIAFAFFYFNFYFVFRPRGLAMLTYLPTHPQRVIAQGKP